MFQPPSLLSLLALTKTNSTPSLNSTHYPCLYQVIVGFKQINKICCKIIQWQKDDCLTDGYHTQHFSLFSQDIFRAFYLYRDLHKSFRKKNERIFRTRLFMSCSSKFLLFITLIFKCPLSLNELILHSRSLSGELWLLKHLILALNVCSFFMQRIHAYKLAWQALQ